MDFVENRRAFLQRAEVDIKELSYQMQCCKFAGDVERAYYIRRMEERIDKISESLRKAKDEAK